MTFIKCNKISSAKGDFSFRLEIESTSHESMAIKIGPRSKNGIAQPSSTGRGNENVPKRFQTLGDN